MHNIRKACMAAVAIGLLAVLMAVPAYGASRKKITSISLEIKADIQPDTDYGQETIEIESSSSRYNIDGYEVMNEGFGWTEDTVPEIRITLTANDDYYFTSLPKDKITLKGGAVFKKATRQDSSSTLLLDVELSSLQNVMRPIENLTLSEDGVASWNAVSTAGSYEVKIYRDGKAVGATMTTEEPAINCRERMTKGDVSYTARVRSVSKFDSENKGDWVDSPSVYISQDKAVQFRENPDMELGGWKQSEDGRWWYSNFDGTYPAGVWQEIKGKWYFFDEEGYMKTGWIQWEGKEYYCSENGDMLTDCLTPDSYLVGADGAKIAQ